VDVHVHVPVDEVEGQLDLPGRVARVGVLDREADDVAHEGDCLLGLVVRYLERFAPAARERLDELERRHVARNREAYPVGHGRVNATGPCRR
jgi:hypothetical protein